MNSTDPLAWPTRLAPATGLRYLSFATAATNCLAGAATFVNSRGKFVMRRDWRRLQHEAAAAQLSFLGTEVETGITFARIAMTAHDHRKISRNLLSARKAYETVTTYLADLPPETQGLEAVRERIAILQKMLDSLEKQT